MEDVKKLKIEAAEILIKMKGNDNGVEGNNYIPQERLTRLPNPQIPISEYNLISAYCLRFDNMTRQDWVELAFIEKLHNDHQMTDDVFNRRKNEILGRPTRGQRKQKK